MKIRFCFLLITFLVVFTAYFNQVCCIEIGGNGKGAGLHNPIVKFDIGQGGHEQKQGFLFSEIIYIEEPGLSIRRYEPG